MTTKNKELETGTNFTPRFAEDGLIPVIAQDAQDGTVLMFAFMNRQALQATVDTGLAHYYSRSRQALWQKGEQSGHVQKVLEIATDCDQDVLLLKVQQLGPGACHVGYRSCFYRVLDGEDQLAIRGKPVYDPLTTYHPDKSQ